MRHFGNTWSLLLAVRATKKALFKKSGLPRRKVNIIVTQVVEFSSGGYKIGKMDAYWKGNY